MTFHTCIDDSLMAEGCIMFPLNNIQETWLLKVVDDNENELCSIEVNYCPFCGRKL